MPCLLRIYKSKFYRVLLPISCLRFWHRHVKCTPACNSLHEFWSTCDVDSSLKFEFSTFQFPAKFGNVRSWQSFSDLLSVEECIGNEFKSFEDRSVLMGGMVAFSMELFSQKTSMATTSWCHREHTWKLPMFNWPFISVFGSSDLWKFFMHFW